METEEKASKPRYGIVNFERRKYPRYSIDLPIEYSQPDSSVVHPGRTVNISKGGILIFLPERVEVGQRLRLKLFFASISESLHTMDVHVEVLWEGAESGEFGKSHAHGVKFIDVNPTDMNKLEGFLGSLTQ